MKRLHKVTALCIMLMAIGSVLANDEELQKRIDSLEQEVRELKGEKVTPPDTRMDNSELEGLEERVERLELERQESPTGIPKWLTNFHLSGNADFVYFNGEDNSHSPNSRFAVDSARLFFDFGVSDDISFFLEWDIVREAEKQNDFTQLYLRIDRVFDLDALNLQIGRTLIPYGEEYPRFHDDRFENPLITFSAPGAWWWDEGILLFGSFAGQKLEYRFSVMDGDIGFNDNTAEEVQLAGKLTYKPTDWTKISLSGLSTGRIGNSSSPGISAMFFSGVPVVPFGFGPELDNFQDGDSIRRDPNLAFKVRAWEVDSIVSSFDWGQLWLAYGQVDINTEGESIYDRDLHYWIAEGILQFGAFSPRLNRFYLAARYSAIGTFDSDEGYSLGAFNNGRELGFNTERVDVISLGVGLRITENVKLKMEYAWYEFTLVDGAGGLKDSADDRNLFGTGISVKF